MKGLNDIWDFVKGPFSDQARFEYMCRTWTTYELFSEGIRIGVDPTFACRCIWAAATKRNHPEAQWLVEKWRKYGMIPLSSDASLSHWSSTVKDQIPYGVMWYAATWKVRPSDEMILRISNMNGRIAGMFARCFGIEWLYKVSHDLGYANVKYLRDHGEKLLREGIGMGCAQCALQIVEKHSYSIDDIIFASTHIRSSFPTSIGTVWKSFDQSICKLPDVLTFRDLNMTDYQISVIEKLTPHVYGLHMFCFPVGSFNATHLPTTKWKRTHDHLRQMYAHNLLLIWARIWRPMGMPRDVFKLIYRVKLCWRDAILDSTIE
jgi:hypothetical protein